MDPAPREAVAETGLVHDAVQVASRPRLDPARGPTIIPVDAIRPVGTPSFRRKPTAAPACHAQTPTDGGLSASGPFGPAIEAAMAMARRANGSRKIPCEAVAIRTATVIQEARIETSHQAAEEVNAGLPARATVGRRPDEGIIMALVPGQARVGIVAPTSTDASDAPSDVARVDVQPEGREASSTLVALLPAGDGDMLLSLDQVVADVGPLVRVVPPSPAVVPYPATVVAEVPVVLHGPAHLLARRAIPTP